MNALWMGALALVLAASAAGAADLPATHLRVVGSWSNVGQYAMYEVPFWTETIPKASNGRVTAEIDAFDLLGLGGDEVYELLGRGLFDIGATVVEYASSVDPRLEGLDMPVIAADINVARRAAEAYKPVLDATLQEVFNAKLLALVPYSAQIIFCNTPISGLADLRGKKIRGSGRITLEFVEAIGAVGVPMAFSEVAIGLERGVVDCAITGAFSGYNARWPEVSTHLYPVPAGGWDHVGVAANLDLWNSLDPAVKAFLEEQLAAYEDMIWAAVDRETQEGISCNTGGECPYGEPGNMTLVPVTEEDLRLAARLSEEYVLPRWAERTRPDVIEQWNETVGRVLGMRIAR